MRGSMPLPLLWGRHFRVHGGPYLKKPEGYLGCKMAVEVKAPADVSVPVVDFSIPSQQQMEKGLREVVTLVLKRKPLYIGCMGGIGRTGLMMAVLAKAFGITDPVEYVREHYYEHAVETAEQQRFVRDFVIPDDVKNDILWAKLFSPFHLRSALTEQV